MKRRTIVTLAIVALFAAICLWWFAGSDEPPPPTGPRPSETRTAVERRARIAAHRAQPPAPKPETPGAQEPPVEHLTVRLGSWHVQRDDAVARMHFQPQDFWPDPAEVDLPVGDDVDALVEALHDDYRDGAREGIVELTAQRRGAGLPDDPWAALVAIEVERLGALEDLAARHRAAESRGEALSSKDPASRTGYGEMLALAEAATERWPEHPIADYAALYLLEGIGNPLSDRYAPDAASRAAMDVLRRIDDPLVQAAALTQIANAGTRAVLTGEDLDLLDALYDGADITFGMHHTLTIAAMEAALTLGDDRRAAAWMARHDATTDVECGPDAPLWRPEKWCARMRQARDNRSSWLVARGAIDPVNWQAALSAAVRRCEADGHTLEATIEGRGTWSDGWTWTAWSGRPSLTACIADTPHEGPEPPPGTRVRLEIRPPSEEATR